MEEYIVIIPYLQSAAQGKELKYAIAGWQRHFKEKFSIYIVGEGLKPFHCADNVHFIEKRRVDAIKDQYRQHLDYVDCFKVVHEMYPDSKGFIFVADDCYAVNDFTIKDVKSIKYLGDVDWNPQSTNPWRRDKAKTREILKKGGYPALNYTTHLPQWYEWDKLEKLWRTYQMEQQSYVFEDLYYNIYHRDVKPIMLSKENDHIKLGLYDKNTTMEELLQMQKKKIWFTNSPVGWTPTLMRFLENYYKI